MSSLRLTGSHRFRRRGELMKGRFNQPPCLLKVKPELINDTEVKEVFRFLLLYAEGKE